MTRNALRIRNSVAEDQSDSVAKPFLKWAGGKTQLLGVLRNAFPQDFLENDGEHSIFVEPFCGSGAVFFSLFEKSTFRGNALLNDINPALVKTFLAVRDAPKRLVAALSELEAKYNTLSVPARSEFFYECRAEFNEGTTDALRTATLFIFLNKTCFNGLFRVNSDGKFNVPFGRYKNPRICASDTIFSASSALSHAKIRCADFEETLSEVEKMRSRHEQVFFYFDPPYKPLSATSSFTAYARNRFADSEQIRLCNFCKKLDALGFRWLLSNSDTGDGFFENLYAGFNLRRVPAKRAIAAHANSRKDVSEILISNY